MASFDLSIDELAKFFDHTNLHADAREDDIIELCNEAKKNNFHSVCVNPFYIPLATAQLNTSDVKVCTVIGFPLGATPSEVKAFETETAIKLGAEEIDMVLNVGAMKSRKYDVVEEDIKAVVTVADGTLVKVILETCYLNDKEIQKACTLSESVNADFIKTSTGFGLEGANIEHIRLIKETVGERMGIKASGGISDYQTTLAMIEAGATRIGASKSVKIINEYKKKF
ncbi:MAG: Deoxyribose-phosphate aldolase [Promethearchaeota archaeon]|nr:MAG: Deoxyribose-phosphate aldolase [Candidatus Lokiarchaeota archaeon]